MPAPLHTTHVRIQQSKKPFISMPCFCRCNEISYLSCKSGGVLDLQGRLLFSSAGRHRQPRVSAATQRQPTPREGAYQSRANVIWHHMAPHFVKGCVATVTKGRAPLSFTNPAFFNLSYPRGAASLSTYTDGPRLSGGCGDGPVPLWVSPGGLGRWAAPTPDDFRRDRGLDSACQ